MRTARTKERQGARLGRPRVDIPNRPTVCPRGHRGDVTLWGRREWTSAPFCRQRFRCVPADGTRPHTFSLGRRVGRVIDRRKVAKHFALDIAEGRLVVARREAAIAEEAALDGFYVLRTPVPPEKLASADVVRAYKLLTRVERAFRSFKAVGLAVRPIHHWTEGRVRAHILLCMLACHVQWHLERAWAPLLFRDEERARIRRPGRAGTALRGRPRQGPHTATARRHASAQLPHAPRVARPGRGSSTSMVDVDEGA